MKRVLLILFFALAFVGTSQAQEKRHFIEITDFTEGLSGAHFGLACFDCPGAFSLMYEIDQKGAVLSDTMLVWTQHYSETDTIYADQAARADMVISCYPNHIEDEKVLNKHVFPEHDDIVVVSFHENNRVTVFPSDSLSFKQLRQREND
jgi:hypothetical protein